MRTDQPFVPVLTVQRVGSRLYIKMACGHRKLANPRLPAPLGAFCIECPPVEAEAACA